MLEADIELGKPWIYEKRLGVIVPIIRKDEHIREYITAQELAEEEGVSIEEISNVEKLKINNKTNKPVFFRRGTIFKGKGTQDRAVAFSVVIQPGMIEIPVKCIHRSHHLQHGFGFSLLPKGESIVSKHVEEFLPVSQYATWEAVSHDSDNVMISLNAARSSGKSITMPDNFDSYTEVAKASEQIKEEIDTILKEIPSHTNQIGAIILDPDGVVGIEVFDNPETWEAIRQDILNKYGDTVSRKIDKYVLDIKFDEETIRNECLAFLKKLIEIEEEEVYSEKNTNTHIFKNKEVQGEYTIFNNSLIHLTASRIK